VTGSLQEVTRSFLQLQTACAARNITINSEKSRLLWIHGNISEQQQHFIDEIGVPVVFDNMELLGGMVGINNDARKQFCFDLVNEDQTFFEHIADQNLALELSLPTLRLCGIPKIQYMMSIHPPEVSIPAVQLFDQRVREFIQQKLRSSSLTDEVKAQLSLPVRHGGLGLTRMENIAPIAYLSTFWECNRHLDRLLSDEQRQRPSQVLPSLQSALSIFDNLNATFQMQPLVGTREHLKHHQPADIHAIQYKVTEAFVKVQADTFDTVHGHKFKVRRESAKHEWERRFLMKQHTQPPPLQLDDNSLQLILRSLLGLPPDDDPMPCSCGDHHSSSDSQHYHSCDALNSERNDRHNAVVMAIRNLCHESGLHTKVEPGSHPQSWSHRDDHKRRDLRISLPNKTVEIDVTIVHSTAPSYSRAHLTAAQTLVTREKQKINKHAGQMGPAQSFTHSQSRPQACQAQAPSHSPRSSLRL
jgi:hypothetical protein